MSQEANVKQWVRKYLLDINAYTFMPVQMGYGRATLDFLACVPVVITPDMVGRTFGAFVAIETKSTGKVATARQNLISAEMMKAGATVVIPCYGVEDVQRELVRAGLR